LLEEVLSKYGVVKSVILVVVFCFVVLLGFSVALMTVDFVFTVLVVISRKQQQITKITTAHTK
jgi:lysylphosphatidylglycerol synthetase-like protein (DUF2156 family)